MTIPSWAKPGAKVVCLSHFWIGKDGPAPNEVLTIASAEPHWRGHTVMLRFVERMGWHDGLGGFHGYAIGNFRPLVSRTQEQDVALFTHLLDGLPVREGAQ